MRELGPRITLQKKRMDCRGKPGNDGWIRLLQPDLRQILKPVLRLHELLHFR